MSLFDMSAGAVQRVSDPAASQHLNTLGNTAFMRGDLARAEALYIAAKEADPTSADAWGNIGLVWHTVGSIDDALKCYMKSLSLNPDQSRTICNLGILNEEMGFTDHAERMFLRALELEPTHSRSLGNLAQLYLKRFDFVRGWQMTECRFSAGQIQTAAREYHFPRWNGLPTKLLAVWPEQGIGDQILYGSLLADLIRMEQPFVCELDGRLLPAFRRSFPDAKFVPKGHEDGFNGCTAHVPIMSLGMHFRRSLKDFEYQPKRFLKADGQSVCHQLETMGTDGKKVAISWRSFHNDINKRIKDRKSASLDEFLPLGRRSDIQLVTVQYGNVEAELATWSGNHIHRPRDFGLIDLFKDIDSVLAVIAACDAVVTTSNVTAHFAGALGRETYLISSPEAPLFYWRSPTDRSLFYPSVRLINAPSWAEAIAKVNEAL